MRWTRRGFLAGTGAVAGCAVLGPACSPGESGPAEEGDPPGVAGEGPVDGVIVDAAVPSGAAIFAWASEIFDRGVRRPGYPAGEWAVEHCADRFRELGLEDVRTEPVEVIRWEPERVVLEVTPRGQDPVELECFPVPYGPPVDGLEVELAAFDVADPGRVEGRAALYDVPLLELPGDFFLTAGSAPEDTSRRVVDPEGTLGRPHRLPFGPELGEVLEPSVAAGAVAFIGSLKNCPGDSYEYFVPYDGRTREIPGVWIRGSDGDWLAGELGSGPVRVRLTIESTSERVESHNVVGELPGADDEVVMIGSHHDGPWSSAVEDASGMSLVFAQAAYWAAQPRENRPHRLVFVLHGGHMCGGAGLIQYIEDHRGELDRVVLQLHLEHAALEAEETEGGTVEATTTPTPRWVFTSRIPVLEDAVYEALETEGLHRSMLLAPDVIGDQPPTDGAFYYNEGVPVTHFLAAPFYLFDAMDTLDKVDQGNLVALSRAAVRIVRSTAGVSAADMRSADRRPTGVPPSPAPRTES